MADRALRLNRQRVTLDKYTAASRIPRPFNGRTAAFGSVNRGAKPCRGAEPSASEIQTPIILAAALSDLFDLIRHIPKVLARRAASPAGEETPWGVSSTPRLGPNPTFSRTNSPVSPVERSRLLTAPSTPPLHTKQFLGLTRSAIAPNLHHLKRLCWLAEFAPAKSSLGKRPMIVNRPKELVDTRGNGDRLESGGRGVRK